MKNDIEGLKPEGLERERERKTERNLALVANRNSHVASLRCRGDMGNELAAADALI